MRTLAILFILCFVGLSINFYQEGMEYQKEQTTKMNTDAYPFTNVK